MLTPEGKPLAGAKLYLTYSNVANVQAQLLGESGDDGQFEFRVDRSKLDTSFTSDPWSTASITAVAEGFGQERVDAEKTDDKRNLTINLLKDVPIHGRILTLEGRPVVGAKISIIQIQPTEGRLDEYLEQVRTATRGGPATAGMSGPRGGFPRLPHNIVTDADGRFTLAGIGAERVVELQMTGGEIEHKRFRVMTRDSEPPKPAPGPFADSIIPGPLFGANFEYLAQPARKIVGTVRERGGRALPGVFVVGSGGPGVDATTDAEGRFELVGNRKAQQYHVSVVPENLPYFGAAIVVPDTPGLDTLVADIELTRGISATGRITADPDGQPNEATVEYYPLFGNKYVERIGRFGAQSAASAKCDADGRYTIPVLPGPGLLAFKYGPWYRQAVARDFMPAWLAPEEVDELYQSLEIEPPEPNTGNVLWSVRGTPMWGVIRAGTFNQVLLINPSEDDDSLQRDVRFERGRTLAVTVETPDGKPPVVLSVRGRTNMQFVREKFDVPEFTVTGLHPKVDRELIVEAPEEKLAAYRLIRAGESDPIELRLEPCGAVAGRLLDEDGEPLAKTMIGIGQERMFPPEFSATTDNDGKFHLDGLVPGLPYDITLRRRPAQMGMGMYHQLATEVVVAPGKTHDLGDLDLRPKAMQQPGAFRRPGGGAAPKPGSAKPPVDEK